MTWRRYTYGVLAAELAASARYFDVVEDRSDPSPRNTLLLDLLTDAIGKRPRQCAGVGSPEAVSRGAASGGERRVTYILNGTLNYSDDIEGLLVSLRASMTRSSRVLAVVYNSYFAWLYQLADWMGIRSAPLPTTFVTLNSLRGLARLAGFELVRYRPSAYVPWRLLGIGTLLNRVLPAIPLVRHLSLAGIVTLRPILPSDRRPSLTIIVPARNEAGNIGPALARLPQLDTEVEVLFVEGHSTDDTWEVIERERAAYRGPYRIRVLKQTGRGKADAVRLGFRESTGELVTILDADLTMPPELLPRFYEAYRHGLGDFVNGNRLLYPMEGAAMQFLNRLGNVLFAKALSYVLDAPVGDSLCGTKLLARADVLRCQAWREDFGDFDPFGDFELLFAASVLGLGIQDVPIRYRERTYGSTNISRFRHGATLLRMTITGFVRVKLGHTG